MNESNDKIKAEYKALKKTSTAAIKSMVNQAYKIYDTKGVDKEGMISDILVSKYGRDKVKAAFAEQTIPQGKTVLTKKERPSKKDMTKLQKLRAMLDKEKKPGKKEEMDCWDGYKKQGTKPGTGKNKGTQVNNCVKEDVPANVVAGVAINAIPLGTKYKHFNVPSETFRKFETGRNKFERWNKFLDMNDSNQKAIHLYASKNPGNTIILQDETTGAMRSIRRRSSNNL
jgi:hypothetical protein|tara:strand:- start:1493 stop:2176 length:684 start_codon:yes stop_codon:yes gene_type:complete